MNTRYRLIFTLFPALGLIAALLSTSPNPATAAPALPVPVCVLSEARLFCYEAQRARSIFSTPENQRIVDFSIAPDGEWLVYRTPDSLYMAQIGGEARIIDKDAPPPALIDPSAATLVWSPDSMGIAYITPQGLKTIYPGGKTASIADRPYFNLRWSTEGGRLAAQSIDGGWTFLESAPGKLHVTRLYNLPADVGWFDDNAALIANTTGGLLRVDAASADSAPAWFIADQTFIKLHNGLPGEVLALRPERGTGLGGAVSIKADGKFTTLGNARLDARLDWGPAPGELLYYITSGTPILVDRATGSEDALPIRRVARIEFGALPLPEVLGIQMDADLYFLAASVDDQNSVVQLWRLTRYGFPLIRISQSVVPVTGYNVQGDKVQYMAGGVTVTVNTDGTIPELATPDFRPTATPPPTATSIPVNVQRVGWQPGPVLLQRVEADGKTGRPVQLDNVLNSPSGRYAVGTVGSGGQLVILDWTTGKRVAIEGVRGATTLRWVGQ
jgi:hypothetical protein